MARRLRSHCPQAESPYGSRPAIGKTRSLTINVYGSRPRCLRRPVPLRLVAESIRLWIRSCGNSGTTTIPGRLTLPHRRNKGRFHDSLGLTPAFSDNYASVLRFFLKVVVTWTCSRVTGHWESV